MKNNDINKTFITRTFAAVVFPSAFFMLTAYKQTATSHFVKILMIIIVLSGISVILDNIRYKLKADRAERKTGVRPPTPNEQRWLDKKAAESEKQAKAMSETGKAMFSRSKKKEEPPVSKAARSNPKKAKKLSDRKKVKK